MRYEVLATHGPNHPTEARTETPTITIRDTVRNTEEHRPRQRRNHRPAPPERPTTTPPHQHPTNHPTNHPAIRLANHWAHKHTIQQNRPNETAPLGHQWSGHPGHLRNRSQDTIITGTPRHRRNTKMKMTGNRPPHNRRFSENCVRGTGTPPGHHRNTPQGYHRDTKMKSRLGHRPRTIADFPKTGASTNVNRVRSRPQTWWLLGNKIRHVMLSWRMADRK